MRWRETEIRPDPPCDRDRAGSRWPASSPVIMENSSPPIKEAFEFEHNRCDLSASYYPVQISRPTNCGEALLLLRNCFLESLFVDTELEKFVQRERLRPRKLFRTGEKCPAAVSNFCVFRVPFFQLRWNFFNGRRVIFDGGWIGVELRGEQSVARDQSICNAASRNRRESAEIRDRAAGSI